MKRTIVIVFALIFMLLPLVSTEVTAAPPIKNPDELIIATIGMPRTVDPAWCYDTASAELIFNVLEPLLQFDGEHVDMFLPCLATDWEFVEIDETDPETGLHYVRKLVFTIRDGVYFHDGSLLTPEDVEYTFERALIQDRSGGPIWMFWEPLFGIDTLDELLDMFGGDEVKAGMAIDDAVRVEDTNKVAFYMTVDFPDLIILQTWAQSWASILSKTWIQNYVIGELGRPEWPGEWGDYTGWLAYHDPEKSPLDDPTPIMCGTGPYKGPPYGGEISEDYWTIVRNENYWGGWPASWPAPWYPSTEPGVPPAGYLERLTVRSISEWTTRRDMFLAGDCDFCYVPREYMDQVAGQPGIRCYYPLPVLAVDALFFVFNVSLETGLGNVLPPGTFDPTGYPCDIFSDVNVRKAFAHMIDYQYLIDVSFQGEAEQPATAIIRGLPCFNETIQSMKYYKDWDLAASYLQQAWGGQLWSTGFTMPVFYNTGNIPRKTVCEQIRDACDWINEQYGTSFTIVINEIDWPTYLNYLVSFAMPFYVIGWLADYPDPHNFAVPFYGSTGVFAYFQGFSDPLCDEYIEKGLTEPDRCRWYAKLEERVLELCPSVALYQGRGRHWERDWVQGWYYNVIYPGVYAYNLWKAYYYPACAETDYVPGGAECYDVNYDGQIMIDDISIAAASFGSYYGPPIAERWHFRADVNWDRQILIDDIAKIAHAFGKSCP